MFSGDTSAASVASVAESARYNWKLVTVSTPQTSYTDVRSNRTKTILFCPCFCFLFLHGRRLSTLSKFCYRKWIWPKRHVAFLILPLKETSGKNAASWHFFRQTNFPALILAYNHAYNASSLRNTTNIESPTIRWLITMPVICFKSGGIGFMGRRPFA